MAELSPTEWISNRLKQRPGMQPMDALVEFIQENPQFTPPKDRFRDFLRSQDKRLADVPDSRLDSMHDELFPVRVEMGRSLAYGYGGLQSSIADLYQMATGENPLSDYVRSGAKAIMARNAPHPGMRNLYGRSDWLTDPAVWLNATAEVLPSLGATFLGGGIGRAAMAAKPLLGASVGGGVTGAALEAGPAYMDAIKDGMDPMEARARALGFAGMVGGLNALPVANAFRAIGRTGRAGKALTTGFAEALTETLEGPAQALAFGEDMWDAWKQEFDVAPGSFLAGALFGSFGKRRPGDSSVDEQPPQVAEDSVAPDQQQPPPASPPADQALGGFDTGIYNVPTEYMGSMELGGYPNMRDVGRDLVERPQSPDVESTFRDEIDGPQPSVLGGLEYGSYPNRPDIGRSLMEQAGDIPAKDRQAAVDGAQQAVDDMVEIKVADSVAASVDLPAQVRQQVIAAEVQNAKHGDRPTTMQLAFQGAVQAKEEAPVSSVEQSVLDADAALASLQSTPSAVDQEYGRDSRPPVLLRGEPVTDERMTAIEQFPELGRVPPGHYPITRDEEAAYTRAMMNLERPPGQRQLPPGTTITADLRRGTWTVESPDGRSTWNSELKALIAADMQAKQEVAPTTSAAPVETGTRGQEQAPPLVPGPDITTYSERNGAVIALPGEQVTKAQDLNVEPRKGETRAEYKARVRNARIIDAQQKTESLISRIVGKLSRNPRREVIDWYRNTSAALDELAHQDPDLAEKARRLYALIVSDGTSKHDAMSIIRLQEILAQFRDGVPIGWLQQTKNNSEQFIERAQRALLADSFDAMLDGVGHRTMNLYRNLVDANEATPAFPGAVTIDGNVLAALGYTDKQRSIAKSKKNPMNPAERYRYASEVLAEAAARYSEETGRELTPAEAQLLVEHEQTGESSNHFAYVNNVGQTVTWEAVPAVDSGLDGVFADMSTQELADLTAGALELIRDEKGNDRIADLVGFPAYMSMERSEADPSIPTALQEMKKGDGTYPDQRLALYSMSMQYVFHQNAPVIAKPMSDWLNNARNNGAMRIAFTHNLTMDHMARVRDAIDAVIPNGRAGSVLVTPNEMIFTNIPEHTGVKTAKSYYNKVAKALDRLADSDDTIDIDAANTGPAGVMTDVPHDHTGKWATDPSQSELRAKIRAAELATGADPRQRSALLDGLDAIRKSYKSYAKTAKRDLIKKRKANPYGGCK